MAYHSVPIKADDPGIDKFFYLCQTKGCGAVINPEFPVALKNPSPVHCKDCRDKDTRQIIEKECELLRI